MTRYVLGFAFDQNMDFVALIRKTRPAWQAGRWNGIGGKVDPKESDAESMVREFKEETGVQTDLWNWIHFASMGSPDWTCICFYLTDHKVVDAVETKTDEKVQVFSVSDLPSGCISNLMWLLPAALNHRQNNGEFTLTATYQERKITR